MKSLAPILLTLGLTLAQTAAATEETLNLEPFGELTLYHATPRPPHVVLFISGDGGWKLGVVDMARELATMDTLVVGLNITRYMKTSLAAVTSSAGACFNPAGDLEELGKAVESRLGYTTHIPPILVGYSSGATLAYAALVQAPPHTFSGALSLGFCPDLIVNMPICRGNGLAWERDPHHKGIDFLPAATLADPWVALQGDIDKICPPEATRTYVGEVAHGELVWLPKVGHGFSSPKRWMRQFKASFARLIHSVSGGSSGAGSSSPGTSSSSPRPARRRAPKALPSPAGASEKPPAAERPPASSANPSAAPPGAPARRPQPAGERWP